MSGKYFWKLKLLCKAIITLKNWYLYPIVYFGLTRKPFVFFSTRNGYKLKIRNSEKSSDIHVFTEIWLENAYLREFDLGNNWTIIDIGSHIGLFSLFASEMCKDSIIFSFEPEKNNYSTQLENIQINNKKNIMLSNTIVSSITGLKKFYVSDTDFAASSIYKESDKSVLIPSTRLEDIFVNNKIQTCNLLKLDCEGAEYEILMNLPNEYLYRIDNICLEYEILDNYKFPIDDVIAKLKACNFLVYTKPISQKMGYLYAKKIIK